MKTVLVGCQEFWFSGAIVQLRPDVGQKCLRFSSCNHVLAVHQGNLDPLTLSHEMKSATGPLHYRRSSDHPCFQGAPVLGLSSSCTLGFPTGRDSATFRDSRTGNFFLSRDKGTPGQKFLHCPGTKGQRDKLKILPREGTGRDFDRLSRPVPGCPVGQI